MHVRAPALLAFLALATMALAGCNEAGPSPAPTTPTASATTSRAPGATTTRAPTTTSSSPVGDGAQPGEMPRLSMGDWWVWTTQREGSNVTDRREVTAFESIIIEGTVYEAIRLNATRTIGREAFPFTLWLRASDLASLRESHDEGGPQVQMMVTRTWHPPCDGIYPLRVGLRVTRTCTVRDATTTPYGPMDQISYDNATYSVPRTEPLTTPAGTFDTFRIDIVSSRAGGELERSEWFSSKACGLVRSEEPEVEPTILTAYSCARSH